MEKGVQTILFHAWSANSARKLGAALAAGRYKKTIHMGIAPFTGPSRGELGRLVTNMAALRERYAGPLAVNLFLSFHNEPHIAAGEVTRRAGEVKRQLGAVTGGAGRVSICPMLEDEWGGNQVTVNAMLAAAAAPFVSNGRLTAVKLRRSSNANSYRPSSLSVDVGGNRRVTVSTTVEYESHGMGPRAGSGFYSNDGNFVCMEAAPPNQRTPLSFLEAKDSASNPTGTPNGPGDKFTLAEYMANRAVNSAPVNLLWRPMYNLFAVASVGPQTVNGRPKAKYNMSTANRTDTADGRFNDVEAACLARFLG